MESEHQGIPRRVEAGEAPLSFAQQRLWFLDGLVPNSPFYNLANIVRLPYLPNPAVLEAAVREIVRRHEVLRTRFTLVDGEPVQTVDPSWTLPLRLVDLSGLPDAEQHATLTRLANEEARRPFDLFNGPLLRATLVQLGPQESVFLSTMHHIVSDGWSLGVFFRELNVFFSAFAAGRPSPLPDLPIQYADFAAWQRSWLSGQTRDAQVQYWREQLADLTVLELPTDRPRSAIQTFRGEFLPLTCPDGMSAALKEISRQHGVTLFMTLLAAFKVLLYRYTGQSDIAVGSPIAGRNRTELESLIGFFVNTLVLRSRLSGSMTFAELLRQVHRTSLDAYANQDLPFETLVEALHPQRDLSRNPLFQVMFQLLNAEATGQGYGVADEKQIDVNIGTSKFDLTLSMTDAGSELTGTLEYNTDLFDARTALSLIEHYRNLLKAIAVRPDACLADLPLVTSIEEDRVVFGWNDTRRDYPGDRSIHDLFEQQAVERGDEIAIEFGPVTATYKELNGRANQLARCLIEAGVRPGDVVAACLDRSVEMIVAMLAILKTGAAYLPLDPTMPAERLEVTLADARVRAIVPNGETEPTLARVAAGAVLADMRGERVSRMEASNVSITVAADAPAYIMYTSGSTGTPKGIVVPHRAVTRLVLNTDYVQLGPGDRIAHASAVSFDAATFEIWGALLNGAQVIGFPKELTVVPAAYAQALKDQRVDVLFITTALFNQLAQVPGAFSTLRDVLFGGELVDPKAVRAVLADGPPQRLLHMYGPTENTTFSSWYLVPAIEPEAATVPIGRAIANSTAYLLDRDLTPVPVGIVGELWVGGDGVAHGYHERPALTAERFTPDPFADAPGRRLYRTGDYARWLPDGSIEFIGRRDDQIKLRGFRIELGEIQSALETHPSVRQALVLLHEVVPGEKRIVAHVAAGEDRGLTAEILRASLKQRLPDYMIPSVFSIVESLPLTLNGKIDREALARATDDSMRGIGRHEAPESRLERVIADVWQRVLGLEAVAVDRNFFDLGGHSLLIARVYNALKEVVAADFGMIDLFQYPTIQALARHIESIEQMAPASTDVASEVVQVASAVVTAQGRDDIADRIARQRLMLQRRAAAVRGQRSSA